MKPAAFTYMRPETISEAVAIRGEYGYDTAILAGGQSLIPMMNFRLARPAIVVDLGGTTDARGVIERDGGVAVAPMTRQRDLEVSDIAHQNNPLIRETLGHVAHAVVRNRGTVCGSIAHADASAEQPTLFVTIDGVATATSPRGARTITGGELFSFHLTSTLEPDEMVTEVWFPGLASDEGYAFTEFARRHGDYALVGVCATMRLDGDSVRSVRVGCSGVASTPARSVAVEQLVGQRADQPSFAGIAAAIAEEVVESGDDPTASTAYRKHLVRELVVEALVTASARANERRAD